MFGDWPALLQLLLFSSLPESLAILYFTFMFWGFRPSRMFRQIAVVSAFLSAAFLLNVMFIPDVGRFWVSFGSVFSILFFVFRKHPLRRRFEITITVIVLTLIIETLMTWIPVVLGWMDVHALQEKPPTAVIPYFFLGSVLFGMMAFLMDRKGFAPGKTVTEALQQAKHRNLSGLLVILCLNLVTAGTLYYYSLEDYQMIASIMLLLLSLLNAMTTIITVRQISISKNHDILSTQETYMKEIENLFTMIRGQRHDFLNHVQVIQAFVQQKKYPELERYVSELVGEIVEINDFLQIGHPALAAIVKSKWIYALERKIELTFSFEGMEKLGNSVRSVDYVKIVGNLLDNAIEEVMQQPQERRWVKIHGWTDETSFYFTISNPAQPLTEEQKFKIFSPGYSTKPGNKHSGIGLSIVNERVRFYKGNIHVTNDNSGRVLTFQVTLPLHHNHVIQN